MKGEKCHRERKTTAGSQALIEMYVSSTLQDVPTALENRLRRFSNSGDVPGHPSQDHRMGDLDAALCLHLDQLSVRQLTGDVPPHAQLDAVGIEYTFAVHRVTRDWLRHCFGLVRSHAPPLEAKVASRRRRHLDQLPPPRRPMFQQAKGSQRLVIRQTRLCSERRNGIEKFL